MVAVVAPGQPRWTTASPGHLCRSSGTRSSAYPSSVRCPRGWADVGWKPTDAEPPRARTYGGAVVVVAPAGEADHRAMSTEAAPTMAATHAVIVEPLRHRRAHRSALSQ